MVEFLERVGGSVNSKAVDSLVRCGAFDFTGYKRSQLLATIQEAINCAASRRKDKESGQGSLFDLLGGGEQESFNSVQMPDIPEIDSSELLKMEKALLGFYVSGHPAEKYAHFFKAYSSMDALDIQEHGVADDGVIVGGLIKSVTRKISKKSNKPFAILQIEDLRGSVECMLFGKSYDDFKDLLIPETPIFVTGYIRRGDEENSPASISVKSLLSLESMIQTQTSQLHLHLFEEECSEPLLKSLNEFLLKHSGNVPVVLCVRLKNGTTVFVEIDRKFYVAPSLELAQELAELIGNDRFRIKGARELPPPQRRFVRDDSAHKEEAAH